jgi:hypothetical protein
VVDQWVFLIVPAVGFFESLSRSSESETTCTWVVVQRWGTAWAGRRGPILGGGWAAVVVGERMREEKERVEKKWVSYVGFTVGGYNNWIHSRLLSNL